MKRPERDTEPEASRDMEAVNLASYGHITILGPLPLLPTSSGPSGRASPRAGRGEKGSGDGEGMVG